MEAKHELLPILGCDHAQRMADVIFVHGLDGDARTTWHPRGQPDHFWPAWLGDDLPDVGVWSLQYAVSASAWKGHAMPLYDRANSTLDLFAFDIGQRPLAFVCHSLGGLLIKQVLRNAVDSRQAKWHAIAEQTRLMVFLSTPHSGANLANWMQYLNKCLGQLLRVNVSVDELEAHHPRLRELNIWYRDHVEALGITTFVYYEKLPTAGMRVVDDTTADPGIPGVTPIALDENHVSICKPTSKGHRVYRRVKELIAETVVSAGTASGRNVAEGIVERSLYTGEIKIEVCQRLVSDWPTLADYFDIKPFERAGFPRGRESQAVWEWLESRGRLSDLARGLAAIGRHDLVEVLEPHPPR
jgi:hypothetical protein